MAKGDEILRVYLPSDKKRAFKMACVAKGLEMSNVAAELIETWLEENPVTEVSNSQTSSQPETIAELVQQNYFALMNAGKISPSRLKELAFAQKPTTAELVIIANNLDIPEELVVELRERTFPKSQSKPKQTNGHT